MARSNALGILGLAMRAGKLIYGSDTVESVAGSAFCLAYANDAGGSVRRNARHLAEKYGVPLYELPFSKEMVGAALGKNIVAVLALTDKGFSQSLNDSLIQ